MGGTRDRPGVIGGALRWPWSDFNLGLKFDQTLLRVDLILWARSSPRSHRRQTTSDVELSVWTDRPVFDAPDCISEYTGGESLGGLDATPLNQLSALGTSLIGATSPAWTAARPQCKPKLELERIMR